MSNYVFQMAAQRLKLVTLCGLDSMHARCSLLKPCNLFVGRKVHVFCASKVASTCFEIILSGLVKVADEISEICWIHLK